MLRLFCAACALFCLSLGGASCAGGQDPCEPNPCTNPPMSVCDGDVVLVYPSEGACRSVVEEFECTYTPAEVDCAESGLICEGGACVVPADPCTPNPCTDPPENTCDGDTALVHPSTGLCSVLDVDPICHYPQVLLVCSESGLECQGGLCVTPGDPCNPNPCTGAPADICSGDTALVYPAQGTCTDTAGEASCAYEPVPDDCLSHGQVCQGGECITLQTGGLFISEYVEGTSNNKYIEIFNGGTSSVNLEDHRLRIYFNGNTTSTSSVTLPSHVLLPGAVYVVGHSSGTVFTPNLTSGGLTFNGNDAVELTDPSLARLDLIGVIGDDSVFAMDITLVRKAGIIAGSDTYRADDWTQLATDTHQLGAHSP